MNSGIYELSYAACKLFKLDKQTIHGLKNLRFPIRAYTIVLFGAIYVIVSY